MILEVETHAQEETVSASRVDLSANKRKITDFFSSFEHKKIAFKNIKA